MRKILLSICLLLFIFVTIIVSQDVETNGRVCGDPAMGYTNVNYDYNLLAVYAGVTQASANTTLALAKSKGFRDANIRGMKVVVGYGD